MRIACEQLPQQLSRQLAGVYAIHGPETLLALEARDRIRAAARCAGFIEREVLTVEVGFNWSEFQVAGKSQSLFASQKLIELRIASGKPGTEGASAMQQFCDSRPDDVLLIVSLPKLDRTALASAWFDSLDRHGLVVEALQVTRERLPQWIGARLELQSQSADAATLGFLADKVEGNLLAAYQEIQKLALLFPAGPIALNQVEHAVLDVARFDVFKLVESLWSDDASRFARALRGLREEGEAPPFVLWAITEEIRALARIKLGLTDGKALSQLFREHRVWGPRQRLVERALKRLLLRDLETALLQASACDRMIKGLTRGDVWQALLQLGLGLQGKQPLVAAA